MNLKVCKEGDAFVIKDDEGGLYGSYATREEAEACRADWVAYYTSPLEDAE